MAPRRVHEVAAGCGRRAAMGIDFDGTRVSEELLRARAAFSSIVGRARVADGPLALAGTPSGVASERAVGPERLVLRDRRRGAVAPLRSAGRAERARGNRGPPRDGDRAHRAVA